MSYGESTSGSSVSVDYERLKEAAGRLQQNAPTKEEVTADPKAFLEKHGVTISDELNRQILDSLRSPGGDVAQAGVVHIDIPLDADVTGARE